MGFEAAPVYSDSANGYETCQVIDNILGSVVGREEPFAAPQHIFRFGQFAALLGSGPDSRL